MDKSDQKHVDKLRRRQGGGVEETTTNALVSKATIGQNQSQEFVEPGGLIDGDGGRGWGKRVT